MSLKSASKGVIEFIVRKTAPGVLRDIRNLRALSHNLAQLHNPAHIDHFSKIHQIVLSKNWAERNMEHLMLTMYYPLMPQSQRNELRAREFKIYSQNGEDGILLYILSKLGTPNKKYVNVGCGGLSSNTANLVSNFGWSGIDIDGSDAALQQARNLYSSKHSKHEELFKLVNAWVNMDNMDEVIKNNGVSGDIGLLSIDIDGCDYWVWKAITAINPQVVIIEYNASFGPHRSITVPYDEEFDINKKHESRWYHGASLEALVRLGRSKGYALVGCESNGMNAFFAKSEVLSERFSEVMPSEAFYPHCQREGMPESQFSRIKDMEYVEISETP